MKKIVVLTFLALSFSCVTTQAEDPVKNKAAFDLNCPKNKLDLTAINEDNVSGMINYGVSGCGKKAAYICQRKIVGAAVCVKESETTVN